MKKLNYLILFFVSTLIIIGLISLYSKQDKVFQMTVIPQAFSLVSATNDDEEFSMGIYFDSNTLPININPRDNCCYIADKSNENQLPLVLLSAIPTQSQITINNKLFFLYDFLFKIDFQTTSPYQLELDEAYLHLNRGVETEEMLIFIGSLAFVKIPSMLNNDLTMTKLKGNVNLLDQGKSVVGFEMKLRNNSLAPIRIERIKPLVTNLFVSAQDSLEQFTFDFSSTDSVKTILGYQYEVYSAFEEVDFNFLIGGNEEVNYYFPLKYQNSYKINQFGIQIDYWKNEIRYTEYIDNFIFFNDYQLSEREINNLIVYTYDNH